MQLVLIHVVQTPVAEPIPTNTDYYSLDKDPNKHIYLPCLLINYTFTITFIITQVYAHYEIMWLPRIRAANRGTVHPGSSYTIIACNLVQKPSFLYLPFVRLGYTLLSSISIWMRTLFISHNETHLYLFIIYQISSRVNHHLHIRDIIAIEGTTGTTASK